MAHRVWFSFKRFRFFDIAQPVNAHDNHHIISFNGMVTFATMTYLRSLAVWLLLMLGETLHGTARIFLLVPLVGDFRARQLAVFTGAALIFFICTLFIKWIKPENKKVCLLVGALWVTLTVGFEVALGFVVFNMPWQRITEDYNLPQGGLMPVGLLLMLFTPLAAARMRKIV